MGSLNDFLVALEQTNLYRLFLGALASACLLLFVRKVASNISQEAEERSKDNDKRNYKIEVVIRKKGSNYHHILRASNLNTSYTVKDQKYDIKPDFVFEKKYSFIGKLKVKLGWPRKFMALFWEDGTHIYNPTSEISPKTLVNVQSSTVLGKALKELFSTSLLANKTLIIFIVAFAVIAAMILKYMGYF